MHKIYKHYSLVFQQLCYILIPVFIIYLTFHFKITILSQKVCLISSKKGPPLACQPRSL